MRIPFIKLTTNLTLCWVAGIMTHLCGTNNYFLLNPKKFDLTKGVGLVNFLEKSRILGLPMSIKESCKLLVTCYG